MKIGILSDTHGHADRVRNAVEVLRSKGAKALFHCGDLTTPEVVAACKGLSSYFVLGNNDFDRAAIERAVASISGTFLGDSGLVELAGKKIALTHGHLDRERKALLGRKPDFLLVGHSHRLGEWREGETRVLNPGALHRAVRWTVALLDLRTGVAEWIDLREDDQK